MLLRYQKNLKKPICSLLILLSLNASSWAVEDDVWQKQQLDWKEQKVHTEEHLEENKRENARLEKQAVENKIQENQIQQRADDQKRIDRQLEERRRDR